MAARRAWGEGTYSQTKDGGWAWRGYYTDPVTGAKKRKWLQAKTKPELKSKVDEWLADQEAGRAGTRIKVKEWCQIWLQKVIKGSVKPRTLETYEATARNHIMPQFGDRWLDTVTTAALQDYLSKLEGRTAATAATILRHWRLCFGAAVDFGYLPSSPASRVRAPRVEERKTTALTDEEVRRLRKVAQSGEYRMPPRDEGEEYLLKCHAVLIELALVTGMREGELFALTWEYVNFERDTVRVEHTLMNSRKLGIQLAPPKSRAARRTISLPHGMTERLASWRDYQEAYEQKYNGPFENAMNLVFSNSFGKPLLTSNFLQRVFYPILSAAGITREGINMHTLRHTHASQLLAAGVNPLAVSQRLGHSSPTVTLNIYAHLLPQTKNAADIALEELYK